MTLESIFQSQFVSHTYLLGLVTGATSILAAITHIKQRFYISEILIYLAVASCLFTSNIWLEPNFRSLDFINWCLSVFLGIGIVFSWSRNIAPYFNKRLGKLTRQSDLMRAGKTDARTVTQSLPKPRKEYDPRNYFSYKKYFLGMGEDRKPILFEKGLSHTLITGTSGSGKGRKLQSICAQALLNDEAVIYLDPKDDEWGPHAMYAACSSAGKPYWFLSLTQKSPPQINILEGASIHETEELLSVAFDLGDKGAASDFYKVKDRKAARYAAKIAATKQLTLSEISSEMMGDENWQLEAPGFLEKLAEMSALESINARNSSGLLSTIIENGGGLYVVGSMTSQQVRRAQQMVFLRLQQIASSRKRTDKTLRTVCIVADEAKYHLSHPILNGLGASRDKGIRIVLAIQSFLDLRDCPADIDPQFAQGAILENTPVKITYRIEDPDTAEWLSRKSGTIQVDEEIRRIDRNWALSETVDSTRTIRQSESYLIDVNKLMNLPEGWAIIYGAGLARPTYISPYRVSKCEKALEVKSNSNHAATSLDQSLDCNVRVMNSFFDL